MYKHIQEFATGATLYPHQGAILFYGGIFSQWANTPFQITIGNKLEKVNCAEQAMMLYKADTFNDQDTYKRIKADKEPWDQKALGKVVAGFNKDLWDTVAYPFVVKATVQKFIQNTSLTGTLLLTNNLDIIEASPTDRIWGIGYNPTDPNVFQEKDKWGLNLLGKAIMEARYLIRENNL